MTEQANYSGGLCVGDGHEEKVVGKPDSGEFTGLIGFSMLYAAVEHIRSAFRFRAQPDSPDTDYWSDPVCS